MKGIDNLAAMFFEVIEHLKILRTSGFENLTMHYGHASPDASLAISILYITQ